MSAIRFIAERLNFGYPPWIDPNTPPEEAFPIIYKTLVEEFTTISQLMHTSYVDCYHMSWKERQTIIAKLADDKKKREEEIKKAKSNK